MRLTAKIKLTKNQIYALLFVLLFLSTRFIGLRNDSVNPDGVNWHYRSQQFVVGLKSGELAKTYQHYHPGVTLMWITGIPIELFKQVTNQQFYNQQNFLDFHLVARTSLIFTQLFLFGAILFYLTKIMGFYKSIVVISLLAFEPFFVGNSRLYHMDALFTLLVFLGLTLLYLYYENQKLSYLILVGIVSSLVFLTRSLGLGLFVFSLGVAGYTCLKSKKYIHLVILGLVFTGFTFLLFPALWVDPIYYLKFIFSEGSRVGVRKGHNQIFFGQWTKDPGGLFYPTVLLLKLSPIILLTFAEGFRRNIRDKFGVLLLIFYSGYLTVMTLPTKKLDRYMVTLFPIFAYYAGLFMTSLKEETTRMKALLFAGFAFFVCVPLFTFFPNYFTYVSPLFVNPIIANTVVGQKPFGMGIVPLRDSLLSEYGEDVRMGFIDTKPMKSVYSNSKVEDIRIAGSNDYDILVLGINEHAPEGLLGETSNFVLDSTYEINGLDYWRVYVKKD